jgi:hypothetical protein
LDSARRAAGAAAKISTDDVVVTTSSVLAGLGLARYNLWQGAGIGTGDRCGEYLSGTAEGSCRPRLLFVVLDDREDFADPATVTASDSGTPKVPV